MITSTSNVAAPPIRLAVLADSASQLFVQELRSEAEKRSVRLDIYEAPFSQADALILDPTSELYAFKPDYTLVWQAAEHLLERFQTSRLDQRASFGSQHMEEIEELFGAFEANGGSKLLYLNYVELDDAVFGSFASKVPESWLHQVRQLNHKLMELAASRPGLFLIDLVTLGGEYGRSYVEDRRIAMTANLLFSLDFLPIIAGRVLDVIDAASGRGRKCLILDLDNTLWGGVVGDDGVEHIELGSLGLGHVYTEIQAWAKALKERGIILAVASKNDPAIASEPFERHPDMRLRLDDIAVFVANWEDKSENIRHIQSILEIGFDAMVFLDDNPAERALVRMRLPDVCVPELPADPVEWMPALRRMNLFETATFTAQDVDRTQQYRQESHRRVARTGFADDGEFLRSLGMVGAIEGFTPFNIPRVAQLTQRSNQFNLRTVRYDEAELRRLADSPSHVCLAVNLTDRFGAHGLISVVILEETPAGYFLDTWLMSCRVLRRGVERLVLDAITTIVRGRGGHRLIGEYRPTPKNGLVSDHYPLLGFEARDGQWCCDLKSYVPLEHFIHREPPLP